MSWYENRMVKLNKTIEEQPNYTPLEKMKRNNNWSKKIFKTAMSKNAFSRKLDLKWHYKNKLIEYIEEKGKPSKKDLIFLDFISEYSIELKSKIPVNDFEILLETFASLRNNKVILHTGNKRLAKLIFNNFSTPYKESYIFDKLRRDY